MMVRTLMETFGFSPRLALAMTLFIAAFAVAAVAWIIRSAPPRTIALTSGPPGSTFQRYAGQYATILASNGIRLRILPSQGSRENLQRLQAPNGDADIGFVQSGLSDGTDLGGLVSLGSVAVQPLFVFYRGAENMRLLSELAGRRIGIGSLGSGTHALALLLLQANGVTGGGPTTFVNTDAEAAAAALLAGDIDAIFLMGDSAPVETLRTLIHSPDIRMYAFTQAEAYSRKYPFLSMMSLPAGSIDLGRNLPPQDVALVGATVELVARKSLHPALSDLILEVAQEVHGKASLLAKRGEFPAPLEHEFKISEDAQRYYKSGKGLAYRLVHSFWLASILNRILVVFVPTLLVLIPAVRILPVAYRWRHQLRIYRHYRPLLVIEREVSEARSPKQREHLLKRLDEIEEEVNRLKVPASFANQFYGLREHIAFVREGLGPPGGA